MEILKILGTGLGVLLVAIAVNLLAKIINVSTWYDFLNSINDSGVASTLKETSILSYIFLIIIYPLILGGTAYLMMRFFSSI